MGGGERGQAINPRTALMNVQGIVEGNCKEYILVAVLEKERKTERFRAGQ